MEIEAAEQQAGAVVLLMQLYRGAPLLHEDAPGLGEHRGVCGRRLLAGEQNQLLKYGRVLPAPVKTRNRSKLLGR